MKKLLLENNYENKNYSQYMAGKHTMNMNKLNRLKWKLYLQMYIMDNYIQEKPKSLVKKC